MVGDIEAIVPVTDRAVRSTARYLFRLATYASYFKEQLATCSASKVPGKNSAGKNKAPQK